MQTQLNSKQQPQQSKQKREQQLQQRPKRQQHQPEQRPQQRPEKQKKSKALTLSIDELRSYPGLGNLTDIKAKEIIQRLEALAQLTFSQYAKTYGHP